MKLPIKTRILEFAIERNKPFKAEELSEVLRVEYNGEKNNFFRESARSIGNVQQSKFP